MTQRKFDVRPPYEIRVVTEPFADPYRILARLHLLMSESKPSEVHIWCIFHFDDEGMITQVEEMLDTAAAPDLPSSGTRTPGTPPRAGQPRWPRGPSGPN